MFRSSFLGLLLLGFSLTIIEGNAEGECKDTQTSAKCAKWKKVGKCAKEKFAINHSTFTYLNINNISFLNNLLLLIEVSQFSLCFVYILLCVIVLLTNRKI